MSSPRIALPFQTVATVNESAEERQHSLNFFVSERPADWHNRLIWGDKKYVLPILKAEFAETVSLIYINLPFGTEQDFSLALTVEGIVPTLPTPDRASETQMAAAVEEQRRLLYVAITRSSSQLLLTYSSKMAIELAMSLRVQVVRNKIRRVGDIKTDPTIAGRYLSELDADALRPSAGPQWLYSYLDGS